MHGRDSAVKLIDLLEWKPGSNLIAEYERASSARAEARLSWALAAVSGRSATVGADLVAVARDLPAESVVRIALAPELEYQVRLGRLSEDGVDGLGSFLAQSLQAELLLVYERIRMVESRGVWTALGDACVRPPRSPKSGSKNRITRAPELAKAVRLDFASPYNRGDVARRFAGVAGVPAREQRSTVAQLREALALVASSSTEAHAFTLAFTRVVAPICVSKLADDFGSFSSSWYPGRTVLVNPHSPRMGRLEQAAALVHEAIHGLIDVSELGNRLLADGKRPRHPVKSPWTGATISLQSLLDAYFVWYGLLWLWQRATENRAAPVDVARAQIERCRRGFDPEFESVVGDELPAVHPFAEQSIASLREAVASTNILA